MTIAVKVVDARVFVEAIPGIYSYLATEFAWKHLSEEGRIELVEATYRRLKQPWPPVERTS
jgi:hypothetical protein